MHNKSIEEIQMLENGLQNVLLQKQAFNMELSETESAINEINKSGDEIFKIIGQLMIKSNKDSVITDLENKKKIINLRLSSLEKQESSLNEQLEKIRDNILK
jgi:prefoldin beta subunit